MSRGFPDDPDDPDDPDVEGRCHWAMTSPEMGAYHDLEWGVPVRDDRTLFERLTLEGAQAGLSWSLILAKREGYRQAFAGFAPDLVARFDEDDVERLMTDASIVRNRLKIESTLSNARVIDAMHRAGDHASGSWCGRSSRTRPFTTPGPSSVSSPRRRRRRRP